jgi:hypothetical protein
VTLQPDISGRFAAELFIAVPGAEIFSGSERQREPEDECRRDIGLAGGGLDIEHTTDVERAPCPLTLTQQDNVRGGDAEMTRQKPL